MVTWVKHPYQTLQNHLFTWLSYEPPPTEVLPYDFGRIQYELRPGDVLLVEGRSRISSVIRTITQSPWTHAAIYVGRTVDYDDEEIQNALSPDGNTKDKTRWIVESTIDRGTVLTPLSFYKYHHLRICRPRGIAPDDLELTIKYMIKALGKPYNVRHIFDLARFLLPWSILPRRWGSSLFRTASGEPESGICSSLIANAFLSVQFPILPFVRVDSDQAEGIEVFQRNPHLFTPKDFDYSPYFEIIKYPLFNPEEPMPYYRRLPWNKAGRLHHDAGVVSQAKIKVKKPNEGDKPKSS